MGKNYFLVKQEPEAYSWDSFVKDGGTAWTGIRNYGARNTLRAMKKGDVVFFYHSVSEKQIVGISRVKKEAYPDPTAKEGDWSAIDLAPVKALKVPVTLEQIKTDPALKDMPIIRQSRLSTMPVTKEQAARVLELAQTTLSKNDLA